MYTKQYSRLVALSYCFFICYTRQPYCSLVLG